MGLFLAEGLNKVFDLRPFVEIANIVRQGKFVLL
jgi:hypothetical protein